MAARPRRNSSRSTSQPAARKCRNPFGLRPRRRRSTAVSSGRTYMMAAWRGSVTRNPPLSASPRHRALRPAPRRRAGRAPPRPQSPRVRLRRQAINNAESPRICASGCRSARDSRPAGEDEKGPHAGPSLPECYPFELSRTMLRSPLRHVPLRAVSATRSARRSWRQSTPLTMIGVPSSLNSG